MPPAARRAASLLLSGGLMVRPDSRTVRLRRSGQIAFELPPREWVQERLITLQEVLERRTERSALLLRKVLGAVTMQVVTPDVGRPYYRALSTLNVLAVIEEGHPLSGLAESGSNSLQWWRRRESNPRPRVRRRGTLHA